MRPTYITGLGAFLPNDPVDNEQIEDVLGRVNNRSSQVKRWVLDYNGIQTRHYAMKPGTGEMTHTNAEMTANAVRSAVRDAGLELNQVECLSCGTSSADQVLPNHAVMVHGVLGSHPMEVVATSGVCCSGMTALKYAYMNVASGLANTAVASGSELASASLRASHFKAEMEIKLEQFQKEPMLAFENEFLRWMLSDGAGAVCVTDQPKDDGLSLRIDWLDIISFANEAQSCMYYGAKKKKDGTLEGFRLIDDPQVLMRDGYLSLAQDVEVLRTNLPPLAKRGCHGMVTKHCVKAEDVDWLLPHYSSEGFRKPIADAFIETGFNVPQEKWFSNLPSKGNTGSASIYIILDEFLKSGRAQKGDRILCAVPESSRFSFALMHLTAV